MKRLFFLIALSLLTIGAWAGRVGEQAALKKASTFMKDHSRTRGAAVLTRVYLPLKTKSAIWSTTDAPLYVFNKDGGGYVIVSGDDLTADILAFSDKHMVPGTMCNYTIVCPLCTRNTYSIIQKNATHHEPRFFLPKTNN